MGLMPEGSERFVEMTHGRARYFDRGTGTPTILLHGVWSPDGGTYWYRNFEALSSKLRVLALDSLGFGLGDRVDRHLGMPYFVDYVREFQDVLGIAKSHVVGHTLGGWIAQVFAYESPERVDKLVVVEDVGTNLQGPSNLQNYVLPTREEVRTRLIAQGGDNPLTEQEVDDWTEACMANLANPDTERAYRVMGDFVANTEERQRYLTPRRWSHINHETLFITSTSDPLSPVETNKTTAASMPNAKLMIVEGGHGLPTNQPAVVNKAILDFLD